MGTVYSLFHDCDGTWAEIDADSDVRDEPEPWPLAGAADVGTVFLRGSPGHRSSRPQRKTRDPGATPRKHAHAILDARCAVVQYATKALRWQFNPTAKVCEHCGHSDQRTPRTVSEDLLAHSFDALGVSVSEPLLCVQWSSFDGVRARLRKVERGFLAQVYTPREGAGRDWGERHLDVQVWGWVKAAGFRVWTWNWELWGWTPCPKLLESPLLERRRCRGGR